jgi:hypothetical protein
MANELRCKSKGAALAILDALIKACHWGTRRDAILAVREWVIENFPPDIDEETIIRINKFFEGDEAEKLGREWYNQGSIEINGKLVPKAEPAHGARIGCLWNADTRQWEPECTPPLMLQQQAYSPDD